MGDWQQKVVQWLFKPWFRKAIVSCRTCNTPFALGHHLTFVQQPTRGAGMSTQLACTVEHALQTHQQDRSDQSRASRLCMKCHHGVGAVSAVPELTHSDRVQNITAFPGVRVMFSAKDTSLHIVSYLSGTSHMVGRGKWSRVTPTEFVGTGVQVTSLDDPCGPRPTEFVISSDRTNNTVTWNYSNTVGFFTKEDDIHYLFDGDGDNNSDDEVSIVSPSGNLSLSEKNMQIALLKLSLASGKVQLKRRLYSLTDALTRRLPVNSWLHTIFERQLLRMTSWDLAGPLTSWSIFKRQSKETLELKPLDVLPLFLQALAVRFPLTESCDALEIASETLDYILHHPSSQRATALKLIQKDIRNVVQYACTTSHGQDMLTVLDKLVVHGVQLTPGCFFPIFNLLRRSRNVDDTMAICGLSAFDVEMTSTHLKYPALTNTLFEMSRPTLQRRQKQALITVIRGLRNQRQHLRAYYILKGLKTAGKDWSKWVPAFEALMLYSYAKASTSDELEEAMENLKTEIKENKRPMPPIYPSFISQLVLVSFHKQVEDAMRDLLLFLDANRIVTLTDPTLAHRLIALFASDLKTATELFKAGKKANLDGSELMMLYSGMMNACLMANQLDNVQRLFEEYQSLEQKQNIRLVDSPFLSKPVTAYLKQNKPAAAMHVLTKARVRGYDAAALTLPYYQVLNYLHENDTPTNQHLGTVLWAELKARQLVPQSTRPFQLDLHHLSVGAAKFCVLDFLVQAKSRAASLTGSERNLRLHIITGRGNRSEHNTPMIRPMVEDLLTQLNIPFYRSAHGGQIVIRVHYLSRLSIQPIT
eukprot:m.31161 g.31161  ORF g.31161 m.31161 type:complete len:814 (+) comp9377_c1_seq1:251-2692(+)